MITRILHQTWKTRDIPEHLRHFAQTWRTHHPDWEYRLWTDQDNRDFIARCYPRFLPVYDAYESPICRADAVRYFLLRHFGGLYVDLDFECLAPQDALLDSNAVLLGEEPELHVENQRQSRPELRHLVCNAWMASPPGHPFWDHVIECMIAARTEPGPLEATGPLMLTHAVDSYRGEAPVERLPAGMLYPVTSMDERSGKAFNLDFWHAHTRAALAVHRWAGSWYRGEEREPALPTQVGIVHVSDDGHPAYDAALHWRALPPPDTASPLVSCLMITRNRAARARVSVECFLRQNYPARELIILDDGEDGALREHVAALADPRIRCFRPLGERATLGELRNRAVALARGTYICQWDDDDYYDPARIACQVAAVQLTRAEACFLHRWTLWWPDEQRLALSTRRIWEGSMLCLKSHMPMYPSLTRGEDTPVADQVVANGRVALLDQPRLYLYVAHSGNTFDPEHFKRHWEAATARFEGEDCLRMLQELSRRLPLPGHPSGLPTGNATEVGVPTIRPTQAEVPETVSSPPPALAARSPARRSPGAETLPTVLILTPVKNAAQLLPRYFELACSLDYPRDKLSLAFLEGDSEDGTDETLSRLAALHACEFARIDLFQRGFGFRIDGLRWAADLQYRRRNILAKCRNTLWRNAWRGEQQVLWVDADLTDYPSDVLLQLLEAERPIVVPNCVTCPGGPTFDLNSFRFSADFSANPWLHARDGISQPPRGVGRAYLDRFRGEQLVELDGVGGTMLLVDARVHSSGILFPDYSYRGFIETEGFAMMARDHGVRCWGMPDLEIVHQDA